ncbi:hypothetical protein CXB51_005341 [Gossypium anomalum]|uniref:Carboxypeptidase n=1 Tax=Gossypium anomalum TaxID=47600 RepID=A0A8J5ZFI8_9ROSI|nr:hypothetical protein CXB51_005341 [Gossypium anomalum]
MVAPALEMDQSASSDASCEVIKGLPGQPANVGFKQYSGYILVQPQHGRALFYYFVEADSANPLAHPLTLWLNGGPSCSSLGFGAFMEHGPFQPGEDGRLVKNQYSWNLESNILYLESPIGVGFSYSNTSSDYLGLNDTTTAKDNMQFLLNWFEEFPQYRNSDLYLSGESYAGQLANPLLDPDISVINAEFLWSHGVISDETLLLSKTVCNASRHLKESIHQNLSKECIHVLNKLEEEMGSYTDPGDLILPICLSPTLLGQTFYQGTHNWLHWKQLAMSSAVATDPCRVDEIRQYLNTPKVQEALHANTTHLSSASFLSKESIGINIIPLLSKLLKSNILVLLFNGDLDSKIPLTQTRIIANMLAKELKLVPFGSYAPWYDKKQVGGWTQSFGKVRRGQNLTFLTFATVRGAAHEVPYTSPSQALTLFQAFLRRSPLPLNRV